MLSEQEKQKIRAEEIYRNVARQELSKNSEKKKNNVLAFLDTQHGRFIASVVVLPILIWFFTFVQTEYTESKENQKLIKRIDVEIVYRVSNFRGRLQSGDVTGFLADIDRNYIYPEFSDVGVQGLMLQLESLVCESKRAEIANARTSLITKDKKSIEDALKIRVWSK